MSEKQEFVIENGELTEYTGPGGKVVIPDGVTKIGDDVFGWYRSGTVPKFKKMLKSVTIPDSVKEIGDRAFSNCRALTKVTIPGSVTVIRNGAFEYSGLERVNLAEGLKTIEGNAFLFSDLKEIRIPASVTSIGYAAFSSCHSLESVEIPGTLTSFGKEVFSNCPELIRVFAPNNRLSMLMKGNTGLGLKAAAAFCKRHAEYTDPEITAEYVDYISKQRKKILPEIYKDDNVKILEMLAEAGKIKKNQRDDYLLPALQCNAEKCVDYLKTVFGENSPEKADGTEPIITGQEFRDGEHYSYDGKKLIKCPDLDGIKVYRVPEGTVEIGEGAFADTPLEAVILPNSVKTLRNGSFSVRGGKSLFVHLPDALTKWPAKTFNIAYYAGSENCCFYVATPHKELAEELNGNSFYRGDKRMAYTGGPLSDLPSKYRKFATEAFLFTQEHGYEDMSQWKDSYVAYIKRNAKHYIEAALENEYLLRLMMDEKILSREGADELVSRLDRERPDLVAEVMDYRSRQFGDKTPNDFELTDSKVEKQSRIIAERQKTIKEQRGIEGLVFVSTGELERFGGKFNGYSYDMSDLKDYIERMGGFYRGSVSSKTDYLICNDPNSDSVKSKKAKELGIPIITEDEFVRMAEEK